MKRTEYTARITDRDDVTRSPEMRDLAYRRTIPFLRQGTHLSIEFLMQEAYVQGLRDAAQAIPSLTEINRLNAQEMTDG